MADWADDFDLTALFERAPDFVFIDGDLDLIAFLLYLLALPFCADFPFDTAFACDETMAGVVATLLGLALRTIGGAAAGSSNGKGASSANTTPAKTIEPMNTTNFRSTTFPCLTSTAQNIASAHAIAHYKRLSRK
ncbi:MAG: hypothetical protein ACRC6G_11100 [Deefgea sp.]